MTDAYRQNEKKRCLRLFSFDIYTDFYTICNEEQLKALSLSMQISVREFVVCSKCCMCLESCKTLNYINKVTKKKMKANFRGKMFEAIVCALNNTRVFRVLLPWIFRISAEVPEFSFYRIRTLQWQGVKDKYRKQR